MKKFIFCVLFFASVFSLQAKSLDEFTGSDWMAMSNEKKTGYVLGFIGAYASVIDRVYFDSEKSGKKFTESEKDEISKKFYIQFTGGELLAKLDKYYSSSNNKKTYIWEAMLIITDKDYWN